VRKRQSRTVCGLIIVTHLILAGCGAGGSSSTSPTPSIPAPTVSISVSPTSITVGQSATLSWSSTNSASCAASGSLSGAQKTSGSQNIDPTSAGTLTYTLACQNSAGASVSASATLTVSNPVPSITSLSPSSASAGGAAFTLTVNGSSFISASSVQWNGNSRTTSYISATQLTASVTAADIAAAGTANVTVVNPTPGGGTSQATGFTISVPAPTVAITVTPSMMVPGGSSSLTWSSSNASACTASGAWAGNQSTSGTLAVSETTIGNYLYTLSCTGAGGTTTASASLLVTNLKASSYENKNHIGAVPVSFPGLNALNAFAIADFFQDGTKSVVLHTLEYSPGNPSTYQNFGHIHFYRQDQTGAWVDNTSTLLANTTGCLHPRKAVVADFNRDGKPDVYFACHGADAPPYPGEQPHVLLSQPNGTYTNTIIPITCYCHGASAADINGDGYPDVLVTDNIVAQTPFFLMNNGDGTFTPDYSRLPSTLKNTQIFSAELIDFSGSGKYDVFLAGNEPGTTNYPSSEFGPAILPNDGSGKFISTTPVNLLVGPSYGLALDILYENGFTYLLKVNPSYAGSEIQKIAYPALQASTIYAHSGAYPNGSTWLDWILPYNQQIVSEDGSYSVSVPQ
jgi:FG-GAP-like repeat